MISTNYKIISRKKQRPQWLMLGMFLFCAIFTLVPDLNKIALYVLIPIMLVLTFINNPAVIRKNKLIRSYFYIVVWMGITALTALYTDLAFSNMFTVVGTFCYSYILFYLAQRKSNQKYLYFIFVLHLVSLLYYAKTNIGFSLDQRLNDENLNANTLAYHTFYSTFAIFIIMNMFKKMKMVLQISLICLVVFTTIAISLMTASRQILVIQVPLLAVLLMLKYMKSGMKSKFYLTIVALLILMIAIPVFMQYYEGSILQQRSEKDVHEDSRYALIIDAIQVGLHNPIFGVGPGNYVAVSFDEHFSHCTYIEMFANCGIIGMILYIRLVYLFIMRSWHRYRRSKDRNYLYFLVFALFFALDNIFYVFIANIWLMAYFFLVIGHSEQYYKEQCLNKKMRYEIEK